MVLLESEKKVRRRCWCGSKIQTATLPDGNTTTDFQNWRVSFGAAKPKRKRTKVVMGLTKEAIEADRTGGYLHERLFEAAQDDRPPRNLFGADYYYLESRRRAELGCRGDGTEANGPLGAGSRRRRGRHVDHPKGPGRGDAARSVRARSRRRSGLMLAAFRGPGRGDAAAATWIVRGALDRGASKSSRWRAGGR